VDREYILKEIRRTAEANGGEALGIARFEQETGIRRADWHGKYWARWGDALAEAGYSPNELQTAYEDSFVIEKLIEVIRDLGRYPVMSELRLRASEEPGFPSHNVFTRLGRKADVAAKVVDYCESHPGFEDVRKLCEPLVKSLRAAKPRQSKRQEVEIGEVYLMKAGRFYKVGRSGSPARREYEVGLKMPEEPRVVHAIRTDDPVGIEAYWHQRFSDRRRRGEWFDLSPEDVAAFKRRRFM
jgi:hypothetical protein